MSFVFHNLQIFHMQTPKKEKTQNKAGIQPVVVKNKNLETEPAIVRAVIKRLVEKYSLWQVNSNVDNALKSSL
jgi:hypothetical protein